MRIATITPIYKEQLTRAEKISLYHLKHHLSAYDNIAIVPEGLKVSPADFKLIRFSKECFRSIETYNKLLLSSEFYNVLSNYDYVLIYQTDCLVFSSNLEEWCQSQFDYIGSPWFRWYAVQHTNDTKLWAIGNGGLSLRKVSSFLDVLGIVNNLFHPESYWKALYKVELSLDRYAQYRNPVLEKLQLNNGLRWSWQRRRPMEDVFWSLYANRLQPEFRVAPLEVGLSFAFEMDPAHCFEKNGNKLPFGCHAWTRWNRAFWEPYLLSGDE